MWLRLCVLVANECAYAFDLFVSQKVRVDAIFIEYDDLYTFQRNVNYTQTKTDAEK